MDATQPPLILTLINGLPGRLERLLRGQKSSRIVRQYPLRVTRPTHKATAFAFGSYNARKTPMPCTRNHAPWGLTLHRNRSVPLRRFSAKAAYPMASGCVLMIFDGFLKI